MEEQENQNSTSEMNLLEYYVGQMLASQAGNTILYEAEPDKIIERLVNRAQRVVNIVQEAQKVQD